MSARPQLIRVLSRRSRGSATARGEVPHTTRDDCRPSPHVNHHCHCTPRTLRRCRGRATNGLLTPTPPKRGILVRNPACHAGRIRSPAVAPRLPREAPANDTPCPSESPPSARCAVHEQRLARDRGRESLARHDDGLWPHGPARRERNPDSPRCTIRSGQCTMHPSTTARDNNEMHLTRSALAFASAALAGDLGVMPTEGDNGTRTRCGPKGGAGYPDWP